MALTADQIERFARQIIIPELGPAGQARLLAARVLVCGTGTEAEWAGSYLRAAGVTVLEVRPGEALRPTPAGLDAIVVTSLEDAAAGGWLDEVSRQARPIVWCRLRPRGWCCGVATTGATLPRLDPAAPLARPADLGLLAAAACDTAARTVAWLLELGPGNEPVEARLA